MRLYLFFLIQLLIGVNYAQTISGGGGSILDNTTLEIQIPVSVGPSAINTSTFGLEYVCINLNHTYLADLTITLQAPDGTTRTLMSGIGGGDDNLQNTCFDPSSSTSISSGTAPFTGSFIPMGQIGAVNNGQNPNGIWRIFVRDDYAQDQGNVIDCSLTFGTSPATFFQFTESDLPIVSISTNGQTIDNDVKIVADMGIVYNGNGVRNHLSDPFNHYDGKIGIEYRGNYSLSLPQKPYSFKLIDNAGVSIDSSLINMPAEHDWLLLAQYNDKSFSRNVISNDLFTQMGHYATRSKYVDVVLDGEYQGIYLLSESIKRDSNRVDIPRLDTFEIIGQDVTGGYIFKVDYWNSQDSWLSNYSPIGFPGVDIHYVYHYPKPDNIQPEQKTYIQNYVNNFESALYAPTFSDPAIGYPAFIKVESFIDYFIVNEVARNVDGFKKSRYFHKDKDHANGDIRKLVAGPVWDFDWAWKDIGGGTDGSGWMYDNVDQDVNAPGWYIRLLQDPNFANQLKCRYTNLRDNYLSQAMLFAKIDSIANLVNESQEWHYTTWGHMGAATGTPEQQAPSQTFAEEVQRLKDWITRRLAWLDINMPGSLNGCSLTDLVEVNEEPFRVYPNPFNESIVIVLSQAPENNIFVQLVDVSGRKIISKQLVSQVSTIDIPSSANNGIYFVELQIDNQKFVQKLLKN